MSARHVVLITYGEPPTPAFGAQLKYSWRILLGLTRAVAPIPAAVLPMIALSRARQRNRLWTAEVYASPLEPVTGRQAKGLARALVTAAPETRWQVHVAWEFRDPLLTSVLDRIPADEPVDIVPMYAADSAFTHEISRQTLARWLARRGGRPGPVQVLPEMDTETLAAISAGHVRAELAARGWRAGPDCALVMAAHGTLLEPPRPIETGRASTEALYRAIEKRLAGEFGFTTIGWLNHVYGGRWTEPPADRALALAAEAGFRRVVYYPFGFLADNAESQLEGRAALRTQPGLVAVHLPCLNESPELLAALARQVTGAAQEAAQAV